MKRIMNILLSCLMIVTLFTPIRAETMKVEGGSRSRPVSSFELKTEDGKETYLAGKEVLLKLEMSLSDELEINESTHIRVKIPSDFISDNSLSVSKTNSLTDPVITLKDGYYEIDFKFKSFSGGVDLGIPISFKMKNGETPNGYVQQIEAYLLNEGFENPLLQETLELKYETIEPELSKEVGHVLDGEVRYFSNNYQSVEAGQVQDGYLSEDLDQLDDIYFRFLLTERVSEGKRNYEKVIFRDKIPKGASFNPEDNPGWDFDEVNRIVSYEYTPDDGEYLDTLFNPTINLKLKFPKQKINEVIKNEVDVELLIHNKEDYESNPRLSDDIIFKLEETTVKEVQKFSFEKSIDRSIINDVEQDRKRPVNWILSLQAESQINGIEFYDYDLAPELKYTAILFDENSVTKGENKANIYIGFADGVEKLYKENLFVEPGLRVDLPDDAKSIRLVYSSDSYVNKDQKLSFKIESMFKNVEESLFKDDKNKSNKYLNNTAKMTHQGDPKGSIDTARLRVDNSIQRLFFEKNMKNPSNNYFLGSQIDYELNMEVQYLSQDQVSVQTNQIIDLIPVGMEYVPKSSKAKICSCIDTEMTEEDFLEPKIVHNFSGTGQTALIWDLKDFNGNVSLSSNSRRSVLKIYYSLSVGPLTSPGLNTNTAYLSWDNHDEVFPYSKSSLVEDIYGISERDKVLKADQDIHYVPPHELMITKLSKGSLDETFMLPPAVSRSEVGMGMEHKFIVRNNSKQDINELYLMDIFPYKGDHTISIDASLETAVRPKRGSEFSLTLTGPIDLDSDKFELYYSQDMPNDDMQSYYRGDHWVKTLDNYEEVVAIKLELKEGAIFEQGEELSFVAEFTVPVEQEIEDGAHSVNSFAASSDSKLQFFESNFSKQEIVKYKVDGYVFEDFNQDGIFSPKEERVFAGHLVELVDHNGDLVLDPNGKPYQSYTNEDGYYEMEIHRQGDYRVRVSAPHGFLYSSISNDETFGSHVLENGVSESLVLNPEQRIQRKNAGFYSEDNQLKITKTLLDAYGQVFESDERFDFKIKVDDTAYKGLISYLNEEGEFLKEVEITDGSFSMSAEESVVIHDIDKYSYYVVEEVNNENYDVVPSSSYYEGVLASSRIEHHFTNKVRTHKVDVEVIKEWRGGKDRPEIEVELLRDREVIDRITLNDDMDWKFIWQELDYNNRFGDVYDYSVREVNVPKHYEMSQEGYTIINTYIIPKTSVTVQKRWEGDGDRFDVEIALLRNGEVFDTVVLSEDLAWTYTWTDLDVSDFYGNEYQYTVDEITELEGYEKRIEGYIITNVLKNEPTQPNEDDPIIESEEKNTKPTNNDAFQKEDKKTLEKQENHKKRGALVTLPQTGISSVIFDLSFLLVVFGGYLLYRYRNDKY